MQRRRLWPGTDTADALGVGFLCLSPVTAADPPLRRDLWTPTLEGYGRLPVRKRDYTSHSFITCVEIVSPSDVMAQIAM